MRLVLGVCALLTATDCGNTVPDEIGQSSCLQSQPGVKSADCTATKLVTYEIKTIVGNPQSTAATPVDGSGTSTVLGAVKLPAMDANGDIYAIDVHTYFSSTNLRIRRTRLSDKSVATLYGPIASSILVTNCSTANIGQGTGAILAGKYYFPCNKAILVYDLTLPANAPTVFAGDLTTTGTTDNTTRALARFTSPVTVVALDSDNLLVSDNNAIRRIGVTADIVQVYCGSIGVSGTTDAACGSALFSSPTHMVKSGNNLYVLDSSGSRIRRVSLSSPQVSAHANMPASASYGFFGTMVVDGGSLLLMTDRWSANSAYFFRMSADNAGTFSLVFRMARSGASNDGLGLSSTIRNTISYLSTIHNGSWVFLDQHVTSNSTPSFFRTFGEKILTY